MGRTVTPTFRVEYLRMVALLGDRAQPVMSTAAGWNCKRDGSPTAAKLAAHVRAFEDSTLPGGVNAHLGVTRVGAAQIVRQSTNRVVAAYQPPMFEVLAVSESA